MDKRVQRVINLDFKKQSFFQRGHFPITFQNGSDEAVLQNPWRDAPNSAPFDQEFYLVMTVQAGGTNGWFQDNVGKKPWFDRSAAAMFDFANATDTWKATWPSSDKDRAMIMCVSVSFAWTVLTAVQRLGQDVENVLDLYARSAPSSFSPSLLCAHPPPYCPRHTCHGQLAHNQPPCVGYSFFVPRATYFRRSTDSPE